MLHFIYVSASIACADARFVLECLEKSADKIAFPFVFSSPAEAGVSAEYAASCKFFHQPRLIIPGGNPENTRNLATSFGKKKKLKANVATWSDEESSDEDEEEVANLCLMALDDETKVTSSLSTCDLTYDELVDEYEELQEV
ncbi:hypothetical protein V6N13_117155 [Hibiscus sabdariffa]